MFGNSFVGWHLMLVLGVLIVSAAVVVGVVLLVARLARPSDPERRRLEREAAEQRARAERAERDTDGLV